MPVQANQIRTFCSKSKLKSLPGRIFFCKKKYKKGDLPLNREQDFTLHNFCEMHILISFISR